MMRETLLFLSIIFQLTKAQECTLTPHPSDGIKSVYSIGVLAFRGVQTAIDDMTATGEYLTHTVGKQFDPPINFTIVPVELSQERSVLEVYESEEHDFIWTSPGHASCVDSAIGIQPLATVISRRLINGQEHHLTKFGGVIFTLKKNLGINTIQDIRGKKVGCASITGFGSGQMQFRELQRAGLSHFQDVQQLIFYQSQVRVVDAVLRGDVDVGFVRTDQLERTKDERTGELVDLDLLKLINVKSNLTIGNQPFPFQASTVLYPEWAMNSVQSVPVILQEAVQESLLHMSQHAAVAPALLACTEEQNCSLTASPLLCQQECFQDLDPVLFQRCDTTAETSLLANDAMTAARIAGYQPALSYTELRNMQDELSIVRFDEETATSRCSRSSKITDAIVCPPNSFKKSPDEIASGCADAGLDCFGFQCVCSPCVEAYDVAFEPFHNETIRVQDSQGCGKFEVCGYVQQGETISFQAIDNKNRGNAIMSAKVLINLKELTYTMNRVPDEKAHGRVIHAFDFSAEHQEVGFAIVEVFVDGVAIPESPFRFVVNERDCQAATGDSLRVPTAIGDCVCKSRSVEIKGNCVELKMLLSSTVIPLFLLAFGAVICFIRRKRHVADLVWIVDRKELIFGEPQPELLGRGAFGLVLLAEYRGTHVAVKRALPPKALFQQMTEEGSNAVKTDSTQLTLFDAPGRKNQDMEQGGAGLQTDAAMPSHRAHTTGVHAHRLLQPLDGVPTHRRTDSAITGSVLMRGPRRFFARGDYSKLQDEFIHEMRHLSKLRHPCITTVMGAVVDNVSEPMLVMEHMEMGSLFDLLHNESIIIESDTVLPIVYDIVQGLRFLHAASPPVVHGDLKSKNVLIDSQFRAKVTDFGLSSGGKVSKQVTGTPLWMAPELLRGEALNSPVTDIYSFGVVLYEVFSRKIPFEDRNYDDAIACIMDPNVNLRPPAPHNCPSHVAEIMRASLSAMPEDRPSAMAIDMTLKALKDSVDTRTDDLLTDIFPERVALALREGQKVKPESHDCVTVFFSDIVGYTEIASSLTPTKVSDLLDRLYTTFDRLCGLHHVFKVETVGDAYMTVTNLARKQNDHVSVMAHFAVDAVNAASRTLIDVDDPSRGTLQIRVGFHSGPVASHVVGSRNPRYSIIGDTVNIASRMESNSKPGRIHCTKTSAELLDKQSSDFTLMSRGVLNIKGKGEMDTYWVRPIEAVEHDASESYTNVDENYDTTLPLEEMLPEVRRPSMLTPDSNSRLVEWNVRILSKYLHKLVNYRRCRNARRLSMTVRRSPTDAECRLEGDPMNEVVQVIDLPEYNPRVAQEMKKTDQEVALSEQALAELAGFVTAVSHMYKANPFHSFQHASHVTQSIDKLLTSVIEPRELQGVDDRRKEFTVHEYTYGISSDPMTHFAVVFSALIHDVDHPGVPNTQLVQEKTDLAAAYKNKSVAEQNSVDLSWTLLMDPSYRVLRSTIYETVEEMKRFRQLVVNTVLATDIVDKQLKELRNQRWDLAFSEKALEDDPHDNMNRKATVVMEHLIQASDIAHTMQHWHIYRKWNERFFVECYEAFLAGRAATDPSINWYKGELGFFDFYIIPLTRKLKDCGVFGSSSSEYLDCALRNRAEWEIRGKEVVMGMMEKVRAQQAKRSA